MSNLGIKNTLDALTAVESACDAVLEAAKDGSFNWLDLRHALAPIKALGEAVKDAGQIPVEVKDLDQAEVEALVKVALVVGEKTVLAYSAAMRALGQ